MPGQTKPFRSARSRNKSESKIITMSRKQFQKTQECMRLPNTQFPLVANGASKSHHVPKSNGVKQPTAFKKHSILLEKLEALSRSSVNGKDKSKETYALNRKGEVDVASRPTHLKPMPGLVAKATDRKKRASSDKEEEITSAKDSTRKLEFSKGIQCSTTKGNERQDEIAIDKENVEEFDEYHKEGDTVKAKQILDSTLADTYCNSGSISSHRKDPLKLQMDKAVTFENVEKRGSVERNMGQFASCVSKKRKELEENSKAPDDDNNVGVQVHNMSCKRMKKRRQSMVTRKDEVEECSGNLNHVVVEDDTISISKNDHAKVSKSSCVEQLYSCSKPIDKPTWSGIFKTDGKTYVSLDGHLSTKSCEKAWSLSRRLLKVVEVEKLLRLEVWPKSWELSTLTGDNIGIYFFPHEMRQDECLDQLVREIIENDLALRTIIGEAEMLIFPSTLLPNHHQTFQRKHYLWGVFKRKQERGVVVEESLNAMGHHEKENQQNLVLHQPNQPNHKRPGEEANQEMIQMASAIPSERHVFPPSISTQEVEASRLKGPTNNGLDGLDLKAPGDEEGKAEDTRVTTNAATILASHGQINPSIGHISDRLMGFVVQKTPKLDRIIRELEGEGALVFAMQGEMVGAGSWAGSKATATQK